MRRKICAFLLSATLIVNMPIAAYAEIHEDLIAETPIEETLTVEEVEAHNQAEQERVQQEEAYNEQAQAEADAQNAEIDLQNAAEKERIDQVNEEREQQYEQDCAQYEQDLEEYNSEKNQKAIKTEEKILNSTYVDDNGERTNFQSVGEYNMLPLKSGPSIDLETGEKIPPKETLADLADKAVYRDEVEAKNTALKNKEYTSTVEVKSSNSPKDTKYKLHLTHYLTPLGKTYEEEIEFDENDSVTVRNLAYSNIAKIIYPNDTYSAFYMYQGDKYLNYYWYQTYGYFEYPPVNLQSNWNHGNEYTFSYAGLENNPRDIYARYEYSFWNTHNIPMREPIKPTLELEEYNPIPHIIPELIDVVPADLWELPKTEFEPAIEEPITDEPVIEEPIVTDIDQPVVTDIDQLTVITQPISPTVTENAPIIVADYSIPQVPESNVPVQQVESTPTTDIIKEEKVPMTSNIINSGNWALINLISMLITFLILIRVPREKEEYEYTYHNNILEVILAAVSAIIFIFTENVRLPMILVDSWTPIMIIIGICNIIIRIIMRTTKEKIEE